MADELNDRIRQLRRAAADRVGAVRREQLAALESETVRINADAEEEVLRLVRELPDGGDPIAVQPFDNFNNWDNFDNWDDWNDWGNETSTHLGRTTLEVRFPIPLGPTPRPPIDPREPIR